MIGEFATGSKHKILAIDDLEYRAEIFDQEMGNVTPAVGPSNSTDHPQRAVSATSSARCRPRLKLHY